MASRHEALQLDARGPGTHADNAPVARPPGAPAQALQTPIAPADDVRGERLSKRLAALGLASRREADAWIDAGWVRVDGRIAVLGERVTPSMAITVDDAARSHQGTKVTILLNKPLDIVSGQAEDGHVEAASLVTAQSRWPQDPDARRFEPRHARDLAPAGRLDVDSTGLLVLTQDGRIARQLIGDDSGVDKAYRVHVEWRDANAWSDAALARLRHGLELDGVALRPAIVERLDDRLAARSGASAGLLRFVLREGRKRQIRRMCEAVGLRVTALQRVRIGGVHLGDLPPGFWRYLRDDELF